jgi:uncharacterized membrane-anchored protein YhcB (DUF1043 family)
VEASVYSLETLMLSGAALLLLGLALGAAMGRRTSSSEQKYRDVERKLDQVLQDKKLYEDEVVEHFTQTAQLLNKLTDSYRDVHNHLAQGAANLCQGEGPVSLEHLQGERDPAEIPEDLVHIQPPLDYAPKSSPDEKGTLHEEFGLERKTQPQPAPDKA